MKKRNFLLAALIFSMAAKAQQTYDICVYGGTSGGVMAAYGAKKKGKSGLLI